MRLWHIRKVVTTLIKQSSDITSRLLLINTIFLRNHIVIVKLDIKIYIRNNNEVGKIKNRVYV